MPIWRAFALATVVVLGVVVTATAWMHGDLIRIRIAPTTLPEAPKRGPARPLTSASPGAFVGTAPWVLSALPECLFQRSVAHGNLAYLRAHLPADATIVANGTTLRFGPCTIFVRGDEVMVRRGPDRLLVPAHVRLYRTAHGLALLRVNGATGELRVYEPPPFSELR